MNWVTAKSKLVTRRLLIFGLALALACCVHELPMPETPNTNGGGTTTGGGTGGTTGGGTTQLATCSSDTVYFSNTILPLVNSVCGKSGCHGTTNRNAFSLTTYSSIQRRLGSANNLNSALKDMADQRKSNYVAPTAAELAQLKAWINQGARSNTCNSCDTTKFTYAATIGPIMNTYCKGCHNGASGSTGVDLSTIAAIQSEIANNQGRLLGSIQWTPPYTGTKQMPQGGNKLPDCYITQVKKWIAAGALNN